MAGLAQSSEVGQAVARYTPHTHEPTLSWKDWCKQWTLEYGDTRRSVGTILRRKPTPDRVRRAVKAAVREHDKGTKRAGEVDRATRKAISVLREGQGAWGSDLLAK